MSNLRRRLNHSRAVCLFQLLLYFRTNLDNVTGDFYNLNIDI